MSVKTRRYWLQAMGLSLASFCVSACTRRGSVSDQLLQAGENVTRRVHRAIVPRSALAREFPASFISPDFRANGTTDPQTPEYVAHVASGFADWRLIVNGLVRQPLALDLAALRALPSRTQITRHDCVEGWSSIGKWSGACLGPLLTKAGLKQEAKYIVFHCADDLDDSSDGSGRYYESIDLVDAFHPQTILAYDMNDFPLSIAHGAPVRLRVERQLGYKHAKYVMRIEAVSSLDAIGAGRGGYWEDRGYEWYAGV